ncbi:Lin1244/Lin1753 domain-containing protein [Fictibacillus nanhaiensis]|uniref:Lin1244/Lin1753 domain-containing protein n=1 Tax=Fictibacillus nanhaiensis TaxID=742169 RepID=UPI003C2A2CB8
MARPKKEGLDYFPLDVDMDQDDKIALIEAKHGLLGFGIVIKLFMKIYKNGYFYDWTEKEQLLFSSRVSVDINSVTDVVNDCIKWGLFNEELFKRHEVLTSRGIQERFLLATSRRTARLIDEEYRLVGVSANNNSKSASVNDSSNPQSKVKESKVKESKVKKSTTTIEQEEKTQSLYEVFRLSFNYEPSPAQIELLGTYIDQDGMEEELVKWILNQVGQLGKEFSYAKGWLSRSITNNIFKLEDALKAQEEYERKKQHSQATRRSTYGKQSAAPNVTVPDWLKSDAPQININSQQEEQNAKWLESLLNKEGEANGD